MSTIISLNIGDIDVDSAKNMVGINHGDLYSESNRRAVRCNQIDYDAFEPEDPDIIQYEMAFVRPLSEIIPRLEIMGFTLDHVAREYNLACKHFLGDLSEMDAEYEKPNLLDFLGFRQFIVDNPILSLDDKYVAYECIESGRKVKGRFELHPIVKMLPRYDFGYVSAYSERSYFRTLIGFLSPYSILRIFGESSENSQLDVVWQYGPVVENGWAKIENFESGVSRAQAVLIATEGSTDVQILRKAFSILRPDIADLFAFTDASTHPQSGTAGLLMLAKALCHVDVSNTVILLFDNDAEGCDTKNKVNELALPPTVKAISLPDLEEFKSFPCYGPDGRTMSNINGRAAAIECYLDLDFGGLPEAYVTWKDRKRSGAYHGALEYKETFGALFGELAEEAIKVNGYDMSKTSALIDHIVAESRCVTWTNNHVLFNKEYYAV